MYKLPLQYCNANSLIMHASLYMYLPLTIIYHVIQTLELCVAHTLVMHWL